MLSAAIFRMLVAEEGSTLDLSHDDPGNWTGGKVGVGKLLGSKYGVSAKSYPNVDIPNLTYQAAMEIYDRDYWQACQCDSLPPRLAILVFDAAVNNGKYSAACWLQMAAGVVTDGKIGPKTLAAVAAKASTTVGLDELCIEVLARRIDFEGSLSLWAEDGLGWSRRLAGLPYKIARLLEGTSPYAVG